MSEPDLHRRLERISRLTRLLDDAIRIPGTKLRFGFDALIGLIPGAGDAVPALISAYLIRESAKMGAPRHLQVRMAGNVALDFLIGPGRFRRVIGSCWSFSRMAGWSCTTFARTSASGTT